MSSEFPVRLASRPLEYAQNGITKVDFRSLPYFQDQDAASTCVVVTGSDHLTGTFSHLTTGASPRIYSSELARVWETVRPSLVLAGADFSDQNSLDFSQLLMGFLISEGFGIMKPDDGAILGGTNMERKVKLFRTRAEVISLDYVHKTKHYNTIDF